MKPLALRKEEKKIIEEVIWFANLKRIQSTSQIEQRFMKLPLIAKVNDLPAFGTLKPSEVEAYRNDQFRVREFLESISNSNKGRKQVDSKIAELIDRTVISQINFKDGKLTTKYILSGVEAVYSFALALILDRGIAGRLKQCGNPNCLRFNLDFEPKGRPRRFCNDEWDN